MEKSTFAFCARSTHSDLKLSVEINGRTVVEPMLSTESNSYNFKFDDVEDGEYVIKFKLSGKTTEHTQIDQSNNIVSDEIVEIADITVDDINIDQLFIEKSAYHHDFNGTQSPIEDKFYRIMGCNGVVKFRFSTPFYVWLLENM
jgi:ribosomal protein L35AE/L33A